MFPLPDLLRRHRPHVAPVFDFALDGPGVAQLDFTAANPRLADAERLRDTAAFAQLVQEMLAEQNATVGLGGYLENRVIYRRSPHFDDQAEPRSLHLGLDVWAPAGTPVHAPLPATVHSLADNAHFGDYGPTVILEHELAGTRFYTLYGHLARPDLAGLQPGALLDAGQVFAHLGPYPENGDWPPHLHFQIIADLQGRYGDFPGVAPPSEREYWANLCLDPMLLAGQ